MRCCRLVGPEVRTGRRKRPSSMALPKGASLKGKKAREHHSDKRLRERPAPGATTAYAGLSSSQSDHETAQRPCQSARGRPSRTPTLVAETPERQLAGPRVRPERAATTLPVQAPGKGNKTHRALVRRDVDINLIAGHLCGGAMGVTSGQPGAAGHGKTHATARQPTSMSRTIKGYCCLLKALYASLMVRAS